MNGIINVLKPAGMTSHDVVNAMRRLTGFKRIGHTGTLDPMAVGVLPICINSATRIIEYLNDDIKRYRCEMQLGIETDTQDIWGTVLKEIQTLVSEEDIKSASAELIGWITQVPPAYSAVHVDGRRLYEYARAGIEVEAKGRLVQIHELKIIRIDMTAKTVLFDISCSKGTYIRTICTEIGRRLNCGAVMSFLVRTGSGGFNLADALTLEEINRYYELGVLEQHMFSMDYPLHHLQKLRVFEEKRALAFIQGGPLDIEEVGSETGEKVLVCSETYYRLYWQETFIAVAIYNVNAGKIISHKVFRTVL
jgi:tRNA pseudouridine55 synthase